MKKIKNNNGFTLLELIISLAILAILMTAVCGLMGFNTINYKKTKADITVQDSAQATYDNISDSIMQATRVEIEGYVLDSTVEFSPTDIGKSEGVNATYVKYCKDSELEAKGEASGFNDFNDLKVKDTNAAGDVTTTYTPIYLKKLTVDYSVPIEASQIPGATVSGEEISLTYNGEAVKLSTSSKDTCTVVYTFVDNKMYISKTYKYMTSKNDTYTDADEDSMKQCMYTDKLNYVVANGDSISGACVKVDAANSSIGIDLSFAERSMSYTTNGMINIRNSYVLMDAK